MKQGMQKFGMMVLLIMLISGCWYQPNTHRLLEHYQKHHDYASLERLAKHLEPGMPQPEVEKIVGKPDYSPAPGIYYYGSHNGRLGLILEYHKLNRAKNFSKTNTNLLRRIILGEIME
jgi:hypothetical protein